MSLQDLKPHSPELNSEPPKHGKIKETISKVLGLKGNMNVN